MEDQHFRKSLFILIGVTTLIRLVVASTLELSVDEVYYWTYALYPDWSHFDHPPMVGFIIQLFSLNLLFDSELAIRFGAIVLSATNTYLIFLIGKSIKNPLTGLYAAFLFNASVYCSVLAGNFILPDTPQLFFWLLSLLFLLRSLPANPNDKYSVRNMLFAGLSIGLTILSKYHGVFIWVGAGLYILFYNRKWLSSPWLYAAAAISLCFTIPILAWNIDNDWISFTFHSDRVTNRTGIRADYFLTEIIGQAAYNNPINYVQILLAVIAMIKGSQFLKPEYKKVLLLNSLPLWLVFTSFSLFRPTLPHWTAPAFTPLILIAAAYLSEKKALPRESGIKMRFPHVLQYSLGLLYGLMFVAWLLINYYPGTIGQKDQNSRYGNNDFTLDMYGWKQIRHGFQKILQRDVESDIMPMNSTILSNKYFPGSEIDYYIAQPLGLNLLQYGKLKDIHKYAWINKSRRPLLPGESAYMISTSNYFADPTKVYGEYFEQILPTDTIAIVRSSKPAYYVFVYRLVGYRGNFADPLLIK